MQEGNWREAGRGLTAGRESGEAREQDVRKVLHHHCES